MTLPASPITPEARTLRTYLRSVFGEVGENYFFLEPASFVAGKNIFFGDNVFLNANVAPIHIGDHAMIAPGCVLMTVDHPKPPAARLQVVRRAITIGRDVWIGVHHPRGDLIADSRVGAVAERST